LLESRMRFALRVRAARYSLTSALGRGLQIGLPLAAIIVASVPIWGMSWYFDTENWAAGIWDSWAAQRTDAWREAMVRAVVAAGQTTLDGRGFMVTPVGLIEIRPEGARFRKLEQSTGAWGDVGELVLFLLRRGWNMFRRQ